MKISSRDISIFLILLALSSAFSFYNKNSVSPVIANYNSNPPSIEKAEYTSSTSANSNPLQKLIQKALRKTNIYPGKIYYAPPTGFIIKSMRIGHGSRPENEILFIKKCTVYINPLALFAQRRLSITLIFQGVRVKERIFAANGIICVESGKFLEFKGILPSFVENITIVDIKSYVARVGTLGDDFGETLGGVIKFDNNGISYLKLRMVYDNIVYKCRLNKVPFSDSIYIIKIDSNYIDLDAVTQISSKEIYFEKLTGNLFNTKINYTGTITNFLAPPKLKILFKGETLINLEKLIFLADKEKTYHILPKKLKIFIPFLMDTGNLIKNNNITGNILLKCMIRGNGPLIHKCDLDSDISSEFIIFKNHKLQNLKGTASMVNNTLHIPEIKATACGGKLSLKGDVKLYRTDLPYKFFIKLSDVKPALLFNTSSNNPIDNTGTLDYFLDINGNAASNDSISGDAKLNIKDSTIEALPLLKPFWQTAAEFINKSYNYTPSEFTGLNATFNISKGKILSRDFILYSKDMYLKARGIIDFYNNIDYNFEIRTRRIINRKNTTKDQWGMTNEVFNTGRLLAQGVFTGTLTHPEVNFIEHKNKP
ncbi:secreted protein [Candidatus Omnitrophus magneticus]|uniref:Secreted protein n=1 Tax=Candidatus Omnitrophus magneticus TaxID=1609969 RepID=A0A0F0CKF3_9BACT|nr:secreted protein [Candidatus Omnitrophus magneticus]